MVCTNCWFLIYHASTVDTSRLVNVGTSIVRVRVIRFIRLFYELIKVHTSNLTFYCPILPSYNQWNDSWVARSQDEGEESGRKWLCGLILVSVTFFATAYTALGIMFWQFSGPECGDSNTILSLTLIFTLMATSFQLFIDGDFSVLTSSVMTLYATYQCYSAVTLNPIQSCNPTLSTSYQTLSSALGMTLTVLSITWATYTAGM